MANGSDIVTEMNYREKIEKMPSRERSIFTAMQVYEIRLDVSKNKARICALEHPPKKKILAFGSSLLAIIASIIYSLGVWCGWWTAPPHT